MERERDAKGRSEESAWAFDLSNEPIEDEDGLVELDLDEMVSHELNPDEWGTLKGGEPAAFFDALSLISLIGPRVPPSRSDVHVFAYLACLMSLFDGKPATEWSYTFSAVPPTLPYSPNLDKAIDDLISTGLVTVTGLNELSNNMDDDGLASLVPTDEGQQEFEYLSTLETLNPRLSYLSASAATTVLYTLPGVVNSIANDAQLSQAVRAGTPRMLLDRLSSGQLYSELHALEEALGFIPEDLVVPASLYVRFLEERGRGVQAPSGGEFR